MHRSGNYAFLTKNEVNSQWGFPTNNSTHRTNILTYQNISNHNLNEWNTFVWQERSFSLYLLSWVKKLVWIFTLKILIINKWLRRAKTSQKNTIWLNTSANKTERDGREGKQNREDSVRLRRKEKWNGEAGRDYIANIVQKEGTAKSSP